MRQCVECCTWVHEACVGLLPDDDDTFSARFFIDIVVHYQLMLAWLHFIFSNNDFFVKSFYGLM